MWSSFSITRRTRQMRWRFLTSFGTRSSSTKRRFLKVIRKAKDWNLVETLLNGMLEKALNPILLCFPLCLVALGFVICPIRLLSGLRGCQSFELSPDDVTYSTMINDYGWAGNVEMALGLYDRAGKEKWQIDLVTFSTMISVYCTTGNFDGALNVYEEMNALGVKPNVIIYNTLLNAMVRAGRPWQVKTIFKMESNKLVPNRITYASLLRAYSGARYAEDALRVYKEMKEKRFEPNIVLYNMLLSTCSDIDLVDKAVEIFEEMKRLPAGCKPESWRNSSLITTYSCIGKVSGAESILNEMLEAGFQPNIFVLTSLIECYGKAKKADDVVRTFNRLLELSIVPDDRFCGCLLNVLTQTPKEEMGKVIGYIERANVELGSLVKLLADEGTTKEVVKHEPGELFGTISKDPCKSQSVRKHACFLNWHLDSGYIMNFSQDVPRNGVYM